MRHWELLGPRRESLSATRSSESLAVSGSYRRNMRKSPAEVMAVFRAWPEAKCHAHSAAHCEVDPEFLF